MSELSLISVIIIILIVVLGLLMIAMVWKKKGEENAIVPDYRTLFKMGIIWFPLGLVTMALYFLLDIPFYIAVPLFAVGIIYLVISLAHRDKWDVNS